MQMPPLLWEAEQGWGDTERLPGSRKGAQDCHSPLTVCRSPGHWLETTFKARGLESAAEILVDLPTPGVLCN